MKKTTIWYEGYDETGFKRRIGNFDDLATALRIYADDAAHPWDTGAKTGKIVGCVIRGDDGEEIFRDGILPVATR